MNDISFMKNTSKVKSPSFLIRIYFTQNANWQGVIQWLDINKTVPFRSVLELINLLNEGVNQCFASDNELDFHSWGEQDLEMVFDIGLKRSQEGGDMNEQQKN